jgi:hypothetical protein
MSNAISITVPAHDKNAVRAAAVFFATVAGIAVTGATCACADAVDQMVDEYQDGIPLSDFPQGTNVIVHPGGGSPAEDTEPSVDAGVAFGMPSAPVALYPTPPVGSGVIVSITPPAPPVDTGFAERTAHLNGSTSVPTPPTPAPLRGAVTLDGEGLPWDRRIHASTKTFRQSDNTWKLIKGVKPELVASVKQELRVAMGLTAPTTPPAPPTPHLTVVPPPAPTPPAPPTGADPYIDFVQFCTSGQQSGRLAYQAIVDTCGKYGITQLPMLNARHDLIPTIRAELEALCQ